MTIYINDNDKCECGAYWTSSGHCCNGHPRKEEKIIKEVMTVEMMEEEIAFEDACGVNDLLQEALSPDIQNNKNAVFYRLINEKGEICGWRVEDKITGDDLHL